MIFRKIDENTVRCILTEQDMEERGLKIEDFFTDKDKTRVFLEELVRQAQEEVGYQTSGDTLAMQVMPLPHNGLAITFSERTEDALKNVLGHIKSALEEVNREDINELLGNVDDEMVQEEIESLNEKKQKKKSEKKKKKNFFRVYAFESMERAEEFCATIPEDINVKSQLYKDETESIYYLALEKGRLSVKKLEQICLFATEFSKLISKQEAYIVYCKEHYNCLIKKNAVKVLRKLAI